MNPLVVSGIQNGAFGRKWQPNKHRYWVWSRQEDGVRLTSAAIGSAWVQGGAGMRVRVGSESGFKAGSGPLGPGKHLPSKKKPYMIGIFTRPNINGSACTELGITPASWLREALAMTDGHYYFHHYFMVRGTWVLLPVYACVGAWA